MIPAGEYSTIVNEAGKEVVDPNGFHFIENTPVNPILMLNLIFRGFVKQANLIFTMLFIAGGVQMIIDTEAVHALMRVLATKFGKAPRMTIVVMMIAFGIMSVPIQMNYFIPFSTVVLMMCLMMGYDALTAAAVIITASSFGSTCGMLNISTTAIANEMAGLPLYHGMGFRWIGFVCMIILTTWAICRYAEKVRKNPEKSYCYGIPNVIEPGDPGVSSTNEYWTYSLPGCFGGWCSSFNCWMLLVWMELRTDGGLLSCNGNSCFNCRKEKCQ